MQRLGPCEIPGEISKVGTKEGWMQKTLFPKHWQLARDHAVCSLPREYWGAHRFSMLSTKKKQQQKETTALFLLGVQALLPIISSTQDKEYLFGIGGLFVMFWKFHENSPSPEPSPEEGTKLEKAHSCLLSPVIQYTHKTHSDYL